MSGRYWPQEASRAYLAAVYLGALALAWVVAEASAGIGDWQSALLADLAATVLVFGAAFAADNTSVYDPYWSVAPLFLALWWGAVGSPDPVRFAAAATLLAVWGTRLTVNFLRGWPGLHHEDWRYTEYRRLGTVRYWMVSLGGLMTMPTLVVFAAMLPVLAATRSRGNPFGWVDAAAIAVAGGAIVLETVADEQKRRHRGAGVVTSGVWSRTRHPNYLGEVGFWWGMFLFALGAGWGNWWTVGGPLAMTILFVAVSVPLMDRRMLRRPGYAEVIATLPALIPLPGRRMPR